MSCMFQDTTDISKGWSCSSAGRGVGFGLFLLAPTRTVGLSDGDLYIIAMASVGFTAFLEDFWTSPVIFGAVKV